MFTNIKDKIILILGALLGFIVLYAKAISAKAKKQDAEIKENALRSKIKADVALREGERNEEDKPAGRGYFNDK